MNRTISLFLLIMIFISLIPVSVKADNPTSFELIPNNLTVDYNEYFNISVFVSPNSTLTAAAIDELTFDSSKLRIVAHNGTDNVSKGNLFSSGSDIMWRSGVIDNTSGNLTDIAWVTSPGSSGEGYLCNITFQAFPTPIA